MKGLACRRDITLAGIPHQHAQMAQGIGIRRPDLRYNRRHRCHSYYLFRDSTRAYCRSSQPPRLLPALRFPRGLLLGFERHLLSDLEGEIKPACLAAALPAAQHRSVPMGAMLFRELRRAAFAAPREPVAEPELHTAMLRGALFGIVSSAVSVVTARRRPARPDQR